MTLTVDDRELIARLERESRTVFPERMRDGHSYHATAHALDLAKDRLQSLLSERDKLEDVTPEMLLAGREQAVLQCVRVEDFQMKRIYLAMLKTAALIQTEVP